MKDDLCIWGPINIYVFLQLTDNFTLLNALKVCSWYERKAPKVQAVASELSLYFLFIINKPTKMTLLCMMASTSRIQE